ncbi:MFS transporter [uncultured Paludibaculum sp.]|uniref:MFS transporter n=1 Tax=uncultured Paludibaculum sp. TaxID=1765020 RepID=UPI002AAC2E76|nr:MFS transporter [uncultured Paludibaculum sp.]
MTVQAKSSDRQTPEGSAPPRSSRIISIQRWSIVLLVAGGALNYVDRATLSVANKLIQDELGIPVAKMGLLLSAFLWAYAFSQLPIGGLIDRFGPRRLLGLGLFGWSLAQAAGGFVTSFGSFISARFALGVGEAPLFPGGARVVRDWFGIRERGFATGLCQSASSLGNFVAVPLLTYLMLSLSWRWMFILVGAAGILLAGVWWMMYRDPSEVALTPEEHRYLTEGDENTSSGPPTLAQWGHLFTHRTTWGMIAGFFGTIYTLWLYTGWLPFYLEHERHMSVARVGVLAAIPYFFGCVGAVVGGWLCDFLTRRGWAPMTGRKLLMVCALCGISVCTVGTVFAKSDSLALALISVSLFLIYIASSAAWATVPVAAPGQFTASLGSIQNFGGYLGGALAPAVTGFIVQRTGSFSEALMLSAAISLAAAAAYLLLVRGTIHSEGPAGGAAKS